MAPSVRLRLPGVDENLQKIVNADMDEAPARRKAREAIKDIQLGLDNILFKTPIDGLKMEESYEKNSRGLEIYTKSWVPATPPKALICYCHGYGDTSTFFFEGIARKLANCGYAVFAMDCPGFGLSEGLHCYIPSFNTLVGDVAGQFSKAKEKPEFGSLPSYICGESLGGAVALKVVFKQPDAWNGAILLAPMCKIADDMVPPWAVRKFLIGLANVFPTRKMVPCKDLTDAAFRDPKKREQAAYNVMAYRGKPRLKTALEMLNVTQEIGRRLEEVSLPLLILHGDADRVTDPSVSKELYEQAKSTDKTYKLYKDAYHALLQGEPDDVVIQVFDDILSWLDERCLTSPPFDQ